MMLFNFYCNIDSPIGGKMFSKLIGKVRIYTCFLTVILLGGCQQQQLQPNLQSAAEQTGYGSFGSPPGERCGAERAATGRQCGGCGGCYGFGDFGGGAFFGGYRRRGFLLLRRAETGTVQALDFRERSPKRATRDMYLDKQGKVRPRASLDGHLAAGIPGTVAGLYTVHREYGKLPWAAVVAPAIALAEKGFPVSSRFTKATLQRKDVINKNRGGAGCFYSRWRFIQTGGTAGAAGFGADFAADCTKSAKFLYRGYCAGDRHRHG